MRSVANSPFFRYPNIRLNQINFAAEIQACAVSMTDDPTLLRRDYRLQLTRFLRGAKRAVRPWRIPNLGPSYNFHRNPFQRAGVGQNIESAEYASIVLDVIYYYEQARARGMKPISVAHGRTLRAFVRRSLSAYWTHSGYLNWDTGLYLYRWHLSRYWAWSCQGLLAIASSKNFVRDDERRWAKHMFDRSLSLYERFTERWDDDRREPGSSLYGVTTKFSEGKHFELARFQALAAEAILRGMGDDPAVEPPPLYAFDPSIGRLAITTPTYNTAIVAVSNGAFPYGGIDIARWFDSRQRVISHIGGRAPAGFGLTVRAPNGQLVTASQRPRTRLSPGRLPIILNKSPQGPITRMKRYPSSPHAGTLRHDRDRWAGRPGRRAVQVALRLHDRPDPRPLADHTYSHGRADGRGDPAELGRRGPERRVAVGAGGEAGRDCIRAAVRCALLLHRRLGGRLRRRVRALSADRDSSRDQAVGSELEPALRAERRRAVRKRHAVARRVAADRDGACADRRRGGGPGAATGRRLIRG